MASYFKGQRTPNIFERARAYDNWNEGNFPPQEDGYDPINDKYKDYKKVYNQLTEKEKTLSFKHPFLAIEIKKIEKKHSKQRCILMAQKMDMETQSVIVIGVH